MKDTFTEDLANWIEDNWLENDAHALLKTTLKFLRKEGFLSDSILILIFFKAFLPDLLADSPLVDDVDEEDLAILEQLDTPSKQAYRHFSPQERCVINQECRRFLFTLEQLAIINPAKREEIINEALDLNDPELPLEEFRDICLQCVARDFSNETNARDFFIADVIKNGLTSDVTTLN